MESSLDWEQEIAVWLLGVASGRSRKEKKRKQFTTFWNVKGLSEGLVFSHTNCVIWTVVLFVLQKYEKTTRFMRQYSVVAVGAKSVCGLGLSWLHGKLVGRVFQIRFLGLTSEFSGEPAGFALCRAGVVGIILKRSPIWDPLAQWSWAPMSVSYFAHSTSIYWAPTVFHQIHYRLKKTSSRLKKKKAKRQTGL